MTEIKYIVQVCMVWCLFIVSIKAQPTHTFEFCQRSSEWENLFDRKSGWFGGDGIFSIPLNGKEYETAKKQDTVLFLFSDSLIKLKGPIKNNKINNEDYTMIHNSMAILDGSDPASGMEFYWKNKSQQKPGSVVYPKSAASEDGDYYWLGDGFVNVSGDGALYFFAYRVRDVETDGFFPFEQKDVTLIRVDKDSKFPYTDFDEIPTDLMYEISGKYGLTTYGNSILVNTEEAGAPHPDGYIYIYGTVGYYKELLVARVRPVHFAHIEKWTFWDGEAWSTDKKQALPVAKGTANEISVSPLKDGRFIVVYQQNGLEPYVVAQMAKSPVGPFYPPKTVWYCDEVNDDKDYFAYNAKAHPSISKNGKLIISYNLNSFDFFKDVLVDANHYRPRFIELDLD